MKTIIVIDENTEVVFKVIFVSSFYSDEYYFQSKDEDQLKEYLIDLCSIYKKEIDSKNIDKNNVFEYMEKLKPKNSFSFGHGRYFYVKSTFEKC